MYSGTEFATGVLFFVNGLIACSMLVGYYTTTSSFLVWFFTCSLQNRNYLVLHGGDVLIRMVRNL